MAAYPIVTAKRRRVIEALKEGRSKTEIAAREQISRKTVRRWQARHEGHGENWLMNNCRVASQPCPTRRPLRSSW